MKKITLLILSFLLLIQASAREIENAIKLTLPEAIALARTKSVDAVVARGELKSAIQVKAHAFSASAIKAIEAAGGKAETI